MLIMRIDTIIVEPNIKRWLLGPVPSAECEGAGTDRFGSESTVRKTSMTAALRKRSCSVHRPGSAPTVRINRGDWLCISLR